MKFGLEEAACAEKVIRKKNMRLECMQDLERMIAQKIG